MTEEQKYKPILTGDSFGVILKCSHCDMPENEGLAFEFKYCPFCGCKIDWSEWEE